MVGYVVSEDELLKKYDVCIKFIYGCPRCRKKFSIHCTSFLFVEHSIGQETASSYTHYKVAINQDNFVYGTT